jgi:ABC-type transport system involved in multi-copper enzyme maturation permease subunit
MIRPGIVFALARAELRLTRRLVRFWIFQAISWLIGLLGFTYYSVLHWQFSYWSATAALINPRFLLIFIGIYYLIFFLLGLIFLGFDVRARDTRERMWEVLDSLPCTNVELLLGKFVGILLVCWIPVVLIVALLELIGVLIKGPIEPLSLVNFSVLMTVPAYAFVLGLTFLLTLLLRNRLIAAVVLVALVVGLVVINFGFVPIWLLPPVDITGGFSVQPASDLLPVMADGFGLLQRLAFLLFGLGALVLAAAVHPRRDDGSPWVRGAIGAGLMLAAAAICVWEVEATRGVIARKAQWLSAHAARADDPVPDLLELSGEIDLRPGRSLAMDLALEFRAPADAALETALFSLNPGYEILAVEDAGGAPLAHTFEAGLLDVELAEPLPPAGETTVHVRVQGVPNTWFAYLDSAFDPLSVNIRDGNIFLLGFHNLIFHPRFVALMPGARWLPASGAEVGRGDPHRRPRDFYRVDLTVEGPGGWQFAGPGRRTEASGGGESGRTRFRWTPPAPVPDVALVGGPLVSRSTEVDGIRLEILLHEKHQKNLEVFAPATEEIDRWLQERLDEAAELGLPYPYDGMTLVEIPGSLRGYAGGWRMDTSLTQPTMVLMREAGFPTARFDTPFKDLEKFRDREGGAPRAMRDALARFFENDFSGGNPFLAAARSFFSYQTAGVGDIGLPLDFVYEDLSARLVTERQGYFSVHHYGRDMGQTVNATIAAVISDGGESVTDALIDTVTQRSEVWDTVLEVSLADLDPWKAPQRALDVLTLKGGAMSRSMLDGLGREKTGELLSELRERREGEAFTRADVTAVGDEIGVDLDDWLDVWLDGTALPGFVVDSISTERIRDSDSGSPRYQTLLTLRNDEPVPGLVRVDYRAGRPDAAAKGAAEGGLERSEPVRVEGHGAVQVGLISAEPLRVLRVVPYLALNRTGFNVNLPPLDEERIVDVEPFIGSRVVPWEEPDDASIVVDDLDAGFDVRESGGGSGLRVGGRGQSNEDTDQGLPISRFGRAPSRWSRRISSGAWGKYRHTIALIRSGDGEGRAVFTAEIPRSGEWELEYHLPARGDGGRRSTRQRGTWTLTIVDTTGSQDATLDADAADDGWNSLGRFEIADGATRVEVHDRSEGGDYVIADAIRWTPVSRGSEAADGAAR